MAIKEFRLDRKAAGAQALEGLWGPGPPGDLLYDMSRRGAPNHATRAGTGAPSQMSDRGRVMAFNGVDDMWTCEAALGIGTDPFTVMAWVWLDSATVQANAAAIAQRTAAAGQWMLRVTDSDGANATVRMMGDAGSLSVDAPVGSFHGHKDSWVHLAVARWSGATCFLYYNGVQVWLDATGGANLNTAELFTIGCAGAQATRWWEGMIDDVRFYRRALSIAEVNHVYNATRWTPYADIALGRIRRHGRHHWGHVRRTKA